ncbi:peptide/nickel transport system substrate-binding protein [Halanaerobium saccharolyticum]|uniref:Peptide/nickel transport system substrate-binding protein n=1 Tax=Halanaerobium saccharolyticum TaxID=43595 RepID=A0A4R6LZ68_9FIRM|nr:ABC transporter substrate-binding protein [Halanaerobium saccharolyticum]TDO93896.1 peptide/nickel transport system substrate-binding protein [Halanaerobium saccharolyticum]
MFKSKKVVFSLVVMIIALMTVTVGAAKIPDSWSDPQTAAEAGITEFNQSPILDKKVESGELPPVEERLPVPEDLQVIEPVEEVGQYGGKVVSTAIGPSTESDGTVMRPWMFQLDKSMANAVPDIAKSFELTNEAKTLTIHLREGLKWSDGHPFTTEDIIFWWEDVAMHEEVNHWTQWNWKMDGVAPEFTAVDDYTLKIEFPRSNPTIVDTTLTWWRSQQSFFFSPKHYLKQFHADYNPEVEEIAEEKGFGNWVQYFTNKMQVGPVQTNTELPTMGAWVLEDINSSRKTFVRNPYYYKVDTEGNQLPYVDEWEITIKSDAEVAKVDALQGNIDFAARILTPSEFPMYKQNEEVGNYTTYAYNNPVQAQIGLTFNVNHPEEAKRKVYSNKKFRQAMSVALNRNEINAFAYRGLAEPAQATAKPGAPYFKEEWLDYYAQYDTELAKELLNEIGLDEKDGEGFRVLPNGETLIIDLEIPAPGSVGGTAQLGQVAELVKAYWEAVGVKVNLKTLSRELYQQRADAGEHDVGVWPVNVTRDINAFGFDSDGTRYATKWAQWDTWRMWDETGRKGEEPLKGIEPPEHAKEQLRRIHEYSSAPSQEAMNKMLGDIWQYYMDQTYVIGTVARPMAPAIVADTLHNVPETAPYSNATGAWQITKPEQWFTTK